MPSVILILAINLLGFNITMRLLGASVRDLQVGVTGMGRHTLVWAAPFHRSGSRAACPGKREVNTSILSLLPECGCNVTSRLEPLPWWTAPSNCEGNKPFHPWVALFGYVVMTRRRVTNINAKMGELSWPDFERQRWRESWKRRGMSLMPSGVVLTAWEDKTSLEFGLRTSSKMRTN